MTDEAKPREATERKMDETLEDTFPASDPPAPGHITGAQDTPASDDEAAQDESAALDEALEDTFPASDPPAVTIKHGRDDADPRD